jgi:hypothetical protein
VPRVPRSASIPQMLDRGISQQLAAEFRVELDDVAGIIPNLEIAHVSTARFVRSHQNVSLEFLVTAIAAVEQPVDLQGVSKLDVTEAPDTLQFLEVFSSRARPVQGSCGQPRVHDEVAQGLARGGRCPRFPRRRGRPRSRA